MANSFAANAFTNNFIRGFSFVDDIKRSNRNEDRLDQRIADEQNERNFQRRRTIERDKQVRENRGFNLEDRGFAQDERDRVEIDRQETKTRVRRGREATEIRSLGPDATMEQLASYADFPEIAAEMNRRGMVAQNQADSERVFTQQQENQNPGAPLPDQPQQPMGFAEALKPPGDELAIQTRVTDDEINMLYREDPEAAIELRDMQNRDQELHDSSTRSERREEVNRKKGEAKSITGFWDMLSDASNTSGDALRDMDPSILTAQYFDQRNNITDPDIKRNADISMVPYINEAIEAQTSARTTAEPGSLEFGNATRKLREAYGIGHEISTSFSPAQAVGVVNGMPLNRNPQLTANVIASSKSGPAITLPVNPDQRRMDETIVHRGTNKRRLTQPQLDSAYRLWKRNDISQSAYQTYLNTGHLPSGTKTSIVQRDPKQDQYTVIEDAAGNVIYNKISVPARDPDKSGRNVLSDDANDLLDDLASAYNTTDYPTRGSDLVVGFKSDLEQNEDLARRRGYDYNNQNDIASLWMRHTEINILSDAMDNELIYKGDYKPNFESQGIGSRAKALFSPKIDEAFASGEFESEIDGETLGPSDITPLKPQRVLTVEEIASIKANVKELAGASPEQVQAAYNERHPGG